MLALRLRLPLANANGHGGALSDFGQYLGENGHDVWCYSVRVADWQSDRRSARYSELAGVAGVLWRKFGDGDGVFCCCKSGEGRGRVEELVVK